MKRRGYAKRFYVMQRRRVMRRKRFRRGVFWLLVFAVITAAITGFTFIPYFRARHVVVMTQTSVPAGDIMNLVGRQLNKNIAFILPGDNLFLVDKKAVAAEIKSAFPLLKHVEVAAKIPSTLTVAYEEYDQWGILCENKKDSSECFWIDKEGIPFKKAPVFEGSIVPKINDNRGLEVVVGTKIFDAGVMKIFSYFAERAYGNNVIRSLQYDIDDDEFETIILTTRDGWKILLLSDTDPEQVYNYLLITLEKEIGERVSELEYVDLRFGNRVFYKYR